MQLEKRISKKNNNICFEHLYINNVEQVKTLLGTKKTS